MNTVQKVVLLVTAAVIAGLLLFGEGPVSRGFSRTYQSESLNSALVVGGTKQESQGPGVTDNGWRILATLVLGGALMAVLHKRKPS
jgi:hypothetical protein